MSTGREIQIGTPPGCSERALGLSEWSAGLYRNDALVRARRKSSDHDAILRLEEAQVDGARVTTCAESRPAESSRSRELCPSASHEQRIEAVVTESLPRWQASGLVPGVPGAGAHLDRRPRQSRADLLCASNELERVRGRGCLDTLLELRLLRGVNMNSCIAGAGNREIALRGHANMAIENGREPVAPRLQIRRVPRSRWSRCRT